MKNDLLKIQVSNLINEKMQQLIKRVTVTNNNIVAASAAMKTFYSELDQMDKEYEALVIMETLLAGES